MEEDHLLGAHTSVVNPGVQGNTYYRSISTPCSTTGHDGTATNTCTSNSGACKLQVDDILNFIGYGPLQVIAFVLAGLTAISYGLESAIFSFIDTPVQEKWNLSTLKYTILPATTGVSNIIGGFLYSILCDKYGRVWPYALLLAQIGVFGLASAFSPNFVTLIVLRNIVSVGTTGAASVVFPTFVEFLPVRNRGKMMVSVVIIQAVAVCGTGGLAWWLIPTYQVLYVIHKVCVCIHACLINYVYSTMQAV